MNIRTIDTPWESDSIVYFKCEPEDIKLRKCLCYHNGYKFIVFFSSNLALSELKLVENGLVIIKTIPSEFNRSAVSFIANLWYKNGKLHNEFGPAISCCYDKLAWSFAWYINDKPWKAIKYESAKRFKLICDVEDGWRYFTFQKERHCVKKLWEEFYGKIPLN